MSDFRLPLAQRITTRDGQLSGGVPVLDSFMANMFREEQEGKIEAVKRPGYALTQTAIAGPGQGMFTLSSGNYFFANDRLQQIGGAFLNLALPGVSQPGLPIDIVSNVTFGAATIAVFKTIEAMWYFNGAVITKVIDVDYPATTVRGLVLLDGTFYVMTPSGVIQGSVLQDPTNWNALNFLGVDQSLGNGVRLVRHLNYCLALCDNGSQAFYDNGNPAPGSPLSPAGNATYLIGCASADSSVHLDDLTIFISKPRQRGRSVSAFQGLSLVTISTPFIDRILEQSLFNFNQFRSFGIKVGGHSFYVLVLTDLGITLVCDLVAKDWTIWTSTFAGVVSYFPFGFYLNQNGVDLIQHISTGSIYNVNDGLYQDAGNPITCEVVTLPYDGQTSMNKFFVALNIVGDQQNGSTVYVSYSDDGRNNTSTPRAVDMGSVRRQLRSLGRSRRRIFKLTHTDNLPLRIEALDFEMYLGDS